MNTLLSSSLRFTQQPNQESTPHSNRKRRITLRNPLAVAVHTPNELVVTDKVVSFCHAESHDILQLPESKPAPKTVQLDLALDSNATMLVVPEYVAQMLDLPVVRHQALHEVAEMPSTASKSVFAVEVEMDGTLMLLEAIADSSTHNVLISPSLLRSLQLEHRRN